MMYLRDVWINGKLKSSTELTADEMVEKLASILTYKKSSVASMYKFSQELDEFFRFKFYKLVMTREDGTVVEHRYLPHD